MCRILMPIAVLLMAGTSWAADPAPNYARSGWYLGVGGGVAFDFLEDAVADKTGGVVDLLAGGSFNARLSSDLVVRARDHVRGLLRYGG